MRTTVVERVSGPAHSLEPDLGGVGRRSDRPESISGHDEMSLTSVEWHKIALRGRLRALPAAIRQWWFPREFRIAPPTWSRELRHILKRLAQARSSTPAPQAPPDREWDRLWADVGTNLWRLRRKMLQPGTEKPYDEMRGLYRHLESIWRALNDAGIEIRDHTGEQIPRNGILELKMIAFQPTAGLQRETIIETIKPSIYCQGHYVQVGEVIVGIPQAPAGLTGEPRGEPSTGTTAGG